MESNIVLLGIFGPAQFTLIIVSLGLIALLVLFDISMMNCMKAVEKKNQKVPAGTIFINFVPIPIVGTIWTMIYCILLCQSMNQQANKKIAPTVLAVIFSSLGICFNGAALMIEQMNYSEKGTMSLIAAFFFLGSLITFIIFWVMIVQAKNQLGPTMDSDEVLDV